MESRSDHDDGEPTRTTRKLAFYKCMPCRTAKKKCLPESRRWPAKCERCQKLDLECSPPERKDRYRARSQDPNGQLVERAAQSVVRRQRPDLQADRLSEGVSRHPHAQSIHNSLNTLTSGMPPGGGQIPHRGIQTPSIDLESRHFGFNDPYSSHPTAVERTLDEQSRVELEAVNLADKYPSDISMEFAQATRSQTITWDDPQLRSVPTFELGPLPMTGRHTRLLRLKHGILDDPFIECELIEIKFDHLGIAREVLTEKSPVIRPSGWFQRPDDDIRGQPIEYEALSWNWGLRDAPDSAIMISAGTRRYRFRVRRRLALALKYLRRPNTDRILWIDAICINMANIEERNNQIQLIPLIFRGATQLCIWLGEDDKNSATAINFIKNEITNLAYFGDFVRDKGTAAKLHSLWELMQRSWFSRRWVVQELVLSTAATIYCGPDYVKWETFAEAVELCVEMEAVTLGLSGIMQKDERFNHVPGWFEHISELGASLLVKATSKICRSYRPCNVIEDALASRSSMPLEIEAMDMNQSNTKVMGNLQRRQNLFSLEYLVSTLSVFEVSEPRDTIYSLLAIARDAIPVSHPSAHALRASNKGFLLEIFGTFCERKPYLVDYSRSYTNVCTDFVCFCIERARTSNPSRALDILCRPWAFDFKSKALASHLGTTKLSAKGSLSLGSLRRLRPESRAGNLAALRDSTDPSTHFQSKWARFFSPTGPVASIPELPSWVISTSEAPFALYPHPGMDSLKIGRINADSLAGFSEASYQSYSASVSAPIDFKMIKLKSRPILGHHSLHVQGFILDHVEDVSARSLGGVIPISWADIGGWDDAPETVPPESFWRTLVADRGKDGKNPPLYYATACQQAFMNGGFRGGFVDTTSLIYYERNPIITEFCRRVQSVTWNRTLIKTKNGWLGLANKNAQKNDLICIIYGCSVPVILRRQPMKSLGEVEDEAFEDSLVAMKACMRRIEKAYDRRARYKKAIASAIYPDMYEQEIKEETAEINRLLKQWRAQEKETAERIKSESEWRHRAESRKRKREEELQRREHDKRRETIATEDASGQISGTAESALFAKPIANRDNGTGDAKESRDSDKHLYYTFLGECYIHGMMDGEAMQMQSLKGLETHLFELR
ncbi:hypothetical protein F5Y19DRAFT_5621 [Xylariaceae sp. FL1651]|nr:hypothetical protein F5Y19DRAFT_5621 [Xylariaceae sp. FL1651]